ncbi:hypothetical protein V1478_011851 [Vespula squamosa]|uniref:Uncharacterized protein n=1 Tax=Vespula squamosa TaxID=30214 RepID=A0ABD2ABQ6_VESSQ
MIVLIKGDRLLLLLLMERRLCEEGGGVRRLNAGLPSPDLLVVDSLAIFLLLLAILLDQANHSIPRAMDNGFLRYRRLFALLLIAETELLSILRERNNSRSSKVNKSNIKMSRLLLIVLIAALRQIRQTVYNFLFYVSNFQYLDLCKLKGTYNRKI